MHSKQKGMIGHLGVAKDLIEKQGAQNGNQSIIR